MVNFRVHNMNITPKGCCNAMSKIIVCDSVYDVRKIIHDNDKVIILYCRAGMLRMRESVRKMVACAKLLEKGGVNIKFVVMDLGQVTLPELLYIAYIGGIEHNRVNNRAMLDWLITGIL